MADKTRQDNYLGNINLKKTGVKVEWTPELLQEWIACSKDPIYFANKYIKIVNVDLGLIQIKLYPYQDKIIREATGNRFIICKMPRQAGKTTAIVAIMLWCVLFHNNYSIAVLANKGDQAREILSRIQLAYEWLPRWMQQGIVEWNKGNLELENGSKILASSTSGSAIRGRSQNLVYLDEFAFVEQHLAERFFASVYPTISSGQTTKVMITSTPNGLNMFYKLWVDSEEGRNDYKRIEVEWHETPGRDAKWKADTIRATSEEQFRVEFGCEFLGSSNTLIAPHVLRRLVFITPIEERPGFKIYERPVKAIEIAKHLPAPLEGSNPSTVHDRLYTLIVDTSRAKGLDYSAFSVIDVTEIPYKQVATYRDNNISPLLYPSIIQQTARFYNEALVLVETNDIGQQVADILHDDLEYENVIYCMHDKKHGQVITGGYMGAHIGVRTSKAVKRIGCANAKTLIENDKLVIVDYDTIYELSRFTLQKQSYEAEEGNDDLVMTLVLFGWATAQPHFKDLTNLDFRARLHKEQQQIMESEMLPFMVVEEGPTHEIKDGEINDLRDKSFEEWLTT